MPINNAGQQIQESPSALDDRFFRLMVESVIDYGVIAIDLEGRILTWNPGAEIMFGYSKDEIIGKGFATLFTPEDRQRGAPERELESAGVRGTAGDFRWQMRKDGSRFWAVGFVNPLKDEAGNLIGYLKVARDATGEKLVEESLRKSETLLNATFELAGVGQSYVDPGDGKLLRVNLKLCEILGYSKEELLEMTVQELTHPEDREWDSAAYDLMIRGEAEYSVEKRFVRKDGEAVWASVNAVAIRDEDGNPVLVTANVEDVTERKRAEAAEREALALEREARGEAESSNRSKDEFITLVSHELRSPLGAILGWTRILREKRHDGNLCDRGIEVIERNAHMQSQLVEDLMDNTRAMSGKLKLEVRPTDVAEVIEKAVEVVRPAAEARGVTLNIRLDRDAGQITGDPDRLQQVVWNLLSNAVKFTNEGGRVEVSLERVDPYVQIAVRDTGRGIRPEFMPYVFERYRQVDASAGRRAGGLGLGLALARQLVEMHGGEIMAESDGEGKGATFTVKLPVRAVYTAETEGAPQAPETTPLAGVWAVVVEDDEDSRELVTKVLELSGARVEAFGSAREAFDLLTGGAGPRPDVLICDLSMPGEDGLSLIRKLREWEKTYNGELPAIALTAYGRAEDRMRALVSGYQLHVTKPVTSTELVAVVRGLILSRSGPDNDTRQ
jgi:PAS domain S-box-containing protein